MIFPLTPEYVPQIAALEQQCFSDPWSEASVARECKDPLSHWLVAVEDGRVVGYIGSQSVPPEADVMNLAVAADCRRRGLGRQLLHALLTLLHSQGIERLFLEVRVSNAPAIALYHAFGFEQVGLRKKYYIDPEEDALILRKELLKC